MANYPRAEHLAQELTFDQRRARTFFFTFPNFFTVTKPGLVIVTQCQEPSR